MFAQKTMEILKKYIAEKHAGKVLRASTELGIPNDTLNRWVTGNRDPGLSKIGPVLDKILGVYSDPTQIEALNVSFTVESSDVSKKVAKLEKELDEARAEIRTLERMYDRLVDRFTQTKTPQPAMPLEET